MRVLNVLATFVIGTSATGAVYAAPSPFKGPAKPALANKPSKAARLARKAARAELVARPFIQKEPISADEKRANDQARAVLWTHIDRELPRAVGGVYKQFIDAALAHPQLSTAQVLERVDASAFLGEVRKMVPLLRRTVQMGKYTLTREPEQQLSSDYTTFLNNTLHTAERLAGGTRLNYRELTDLANAYILATDPSHFENLKQLKHGDATAWFNENKALFPFHPMVFTSKDLSVAEINRATTLGIGYVGLLKPAHVAIADGRYFGPTEFFDHDLSHAATIASGDGYDVGVNPDQTLVVDKLPNRRRAFLQTAAKRVKFRDAFETFSAQFPSRTDRDVLEAKWFTMTHEQGMASDPEAFKTVFKNPRRYRSVFHDVKDPEWLGSSISHPETLTEEHVKALEKSFEDFVNGYRS